MKCGGFFYLCIKSDKEYGTSKPPSTLHYLRCRNPRYDDSYLGNKRNYLLLQTQRIQVPNESRSQRQRPARHRQGSMVRKQNERTILLQSRVIPLSLRLIFHILAPRPLSTRLGAFLFPETFSHKFFPKFFPPKGRLTFFCIFGAENYEGENFGLSGNRGGYPLLYAPRLPLSSSLSCFHRGKFSDNRGKFSAKRGKS